MALTTADYCRTWRDKNRDKLKAYKKKWRDGRTQASIDRERATTAAYMVRKKEKDRMDPDGTDFVRFESLISRYKDLTIDKYHSILERQNFCCPVCGADVVSAKTRQIHIDHDHATDTVRGILCARCNTGIGKLGEGRLLRSAMRYLSRDTGATA